METKTEILNASKEIIKISKKLTKAGAIGAQEGNVSCKIGDLILITPSGKNKEDLDPHQMSVIDMNGKWIAGPFKPSSEAAMHVAMYKMRPDANAIVHTHSPYATAFAMAGDPIEIKNNAEFAIFYKKVPVIKYGTPGTDDIFRGMANELVDYDTVLLENHGVVSVGKSLIDACSKSLTLELILQTFVINRQLFPNRLNDLTQKELEKLWAFGRENKHGMPDKFKNPFQQRVAGSGLRA